MLMTKLITFTKILNLSPPHSVSKIRTGLGVNPKLLLTAYAIGFDPNTFTQTSRVVVAIQYALQQCILAAFDADITQIENTLGLDNFRIISIVSI